MNIPLRPLPKILRQNLFLLVSAGSAALLSACVSPDVQRQLNTLEKRQDSLLTLVKAMQDKQDFMAGRMGWRPPPDTGFKEIPLGSSPAQGADKPLLTVVEFSDLQCPYCAQLAPTLDSLARTYPGEVKVVFKHFPLSFHEKAPEAAAAAMAAGRQGKFFEFRYRVAPHFARLGDSLYLELARDLNLDLEKFKADKALTPETEAVIDADMELGRKVGVEGTPTVFVNGKLALDRSYRYFEAKLAEARRKKG